MTIDVVGVEHILGQHVVGRRGVFLLCSHGDAQAVICHSRWLPTGVHVEGVLRVCGARGCVGKREDRVNHVCGTVHHRSCIVKHFDEHFDVDLVVRADVAVHHTSHHATVGAGRGLLKGSQTVFPHVEDVAVGDLGDFEVVHNVVGRHRHVVNAPVVVAVRVACLRRLTVRKTQVDRIHVGGHTAHVHAHRERVGGSRVGRLDERTVRIERRPRRHTIFRGSDLQIHRSVGETAVTEVRLPAHDH